MFYVFRWMKIIITYSLSVHSPKRCGGKLANELDGKMEAKIGVCQVSFSIAKNGRNWMAEILLG